MYTLFVNLATLQLMFMFYTAINHIKIMATNIGPLNTDTEKTDWNPPPQTW